MCINYPMTMYPVYNVYTLLYTLQKMPHKDATNNNLPLICTELCAINI